MKRAMHFLESMPDVLVRHPPTYQDERGKFTVQYFDITGKWKQDAIVESRAGVLRGMHMQLKHPQGKLITCIAGVVLDAVVDMRLESSTFGDWATYVLTGWERTQIIVPRGFLHGYLVLSDFATVHYKVDADYHPEDEVVMRWNDETVGIDWNVAGSPVLSEKDAGGLSFDEVVELIKRNHESQEID